MIVWLRERGVSYVDALAVALEAFMGIRRSFAVAFFSAYTPCASD